MVELRGDCVRTKLKPWNMAVMHESAAPPSGRASAQNACDQVVEPTHVMHVPSARGASFSFWRTVARAQIALAANHQFSLMPVARHPTSLALPCLAQNLHASRFRMWRNQDRGAGFGGFAAQAEIVMIWSFASFQIAPDCKGHVWQWVT